MTISDKAKINNRVGIEKRSDIEDYKTQFGLFEIDTVVGTGNKYFLLTVVDKANILRCIRKMPNKQADIVVEMFINIVNSTFHNFKTLTSDKGTEFAGHEEVTEITDADF
ncbi:hypothetical protein [Candidatus Enterovibrio escicola]|nr:hypothetical protein [Candidatus Enterovibrio escacola]